MTVDVSRRGPRGVLKLWARLITENGFPLCSHLLDVEQQDVLYISYFSPCFYLQTAGLLAISVSYVINFTVPLFIKSWVVSDKVVIQHKPHRDFIYTQLAY